MMHMTVRKMTATYQNNDRREFNPSIRIGRSDSVWMPYCLVIDLCFFLFFGSSAHRYLRTFVQILPFFHYRPADESEDLDAEWVQGVQGGEGSGSGASAPAPAQLS